MKQKLKDLIHSLIEAGVTYAKENPRNILKVSAKVTAATFAGAGGAFAIHGWPLTGGLVSAIAAGAVCLDGYLSDSSGKEDKEK